MIMLENINTIETGKAGETDHRATVERESRKMRLING